MYERCWVGADHVLTLLAIVLSVVCFGLLCALARQTESARRYRSLFNEASSNLRILRNQLNTLRFERTFRARD